MTRVGSGSSALAVLSSGRIRGNTKPIKPMTSSATATTTTIGYIVAWRSCELIVSCQSMYSTSWRSAYPSSPLASPARIVPTHSSGNACGCSAIAADRLFAFFGDGVADLADDRAQPLRRQSVRDVVERVENRDADVERAGDVFEKREELSALDAAIGELANRRGALANFACG